MINAKIKLSFTTNNNIKYNIKNSFEMNFKTGILKPVKALVWLQSSICRPDIII